MEPGCGIGILSEAIEYYVGGEEPAGVWYAAGGDFGIADVATVERDAFERLFPGHDGHGKSLISGAGRRIDRVQAFDVTLSAPRSVSLAWTLTDDGTRSRIEAAQAKATLDLLEREAAFARRGRGGSIIDKVRLTAACFQHGESRPADGRVFADPNLHTHCVIFNMVSRTDDTVGALHSKFLRDRKMAAGATYHAALAAELQALGLCTDRIGHSGTFEVAGVGEEAIRYFSARRQEIFARDACAADRGAPCRGKSHFCRRSPTA